MTHGLGLGDAYGAMLSRMKRQDEDKARLGIAALMWISHAERPLEADELCYALSIEIGSPNLNADNVPSIGTLLACCQGLVVVEKEVSTVRLIHSTLQEYLRAHTDLFGAADSTIAETCLSYLNSQKVKAISTSSSPSLQDIPFLEYSSLYWGVHTKRSLSDCAKQLALKLFDDCNSHISTKILLRAHDVWGVDMDKVSRLSGLHCACLFGIVEIVAGLVEIEGCDINQIDFTGSTPLHWAARSGDVGVVKALLGRGGVNLDTPDNGDTPLHVAACFAREDVMEILIQQDINPHKPNFNGQTAFYHASARGHEGIVKILLEQDGVNPDGSDVFGQRPLRSAAQNGHGGMVKLLLGLGCVNPDRPAFIGDTPLHQAARSGDVGVVKALLGRGGVNLDTPDANGDTPLHVAACFAREDVMEILLQQDINPHKPNFNGQTAFYHAAARGYEGIVKILLEQDGVNPDGSDIFGQTPLWAAAQNGHERMVKLLLGLDCVNPNKLGMYGLTPLDQATANGHQRVIALLQPRQSAAPTFHKGEELSPYFSPSSTDTLCAIPH